MRIVVVGATGRTGLQVVQQALAQGHFVTAVVRTPSKLNLNHERLTVVRGDVMDASSMTGALQGQDAILSALGTTRLSPTTVYSEGTRNIMAAMQQAGIRRFIAVTAGGTRPSPNTAFFFRFIIRPLLHNIYADMARMEDLVMAARLDWTIVRPAQLIDSPPRGNYRLEETMAMKGGNKIARSDLAAFMLKELTQPKFIRKAVAIAY